MNADLIHVLLIDDDPQDAYLTTTALRAAHQPAYSVTHVLRLADAFDALQATSFDIVLLDLGLPASQGMLTLDLFRERDSSTPVVVLSGLEDEDVAMRSLEHHAQDYLFKNDVNTRSLSRAIRYAIQRQAGVAKIRRLLARLRENEEILQRKNARLKTLYQTAHNFVDSVSHEFRTPLTVIKEYVALVGDGTLGEITAEQRRFLSIVEDRANDLNTMVDDMLDVSKFEAGLLSVSRKRHEANRVVERVLPTLSQKAAVKELTLALNLADDLPQVFCDEEKIGRVLINLAINAMKFTRPGGNVQIWARPADKSVEFGVTDNGRGIAEDSLNSIFERFKQVDVDIRDSTKGFGLGLGIAKELVELNLGSMHVESELGVGSTFSFTVPVADPVEVIERYLEKLIRSRNDFLTAIVASVDRRVAESDADDIEVHLSHLARSNDLAMRMDSHHWTLILPEPASEAALFLERAIHDLELTNRNRPRGRLPEVDFRIDGSWSNLRITKEEIISRVHSQAGLSEATHA